MIRHALSAILVLCLVLGAVRRADSHQLDEYLQATRLDISRDRVVVEITLTPGASVAPELIAMVDADGDHILAPAEIEAYTKQVIEDVRLTIDGHQSPLSPTRVVMPAVDDIREGMGAIRIEAVARVALGSRTGSQLVFENVHEPVPSVYAVNALKPDDRPGGIIIRAQRRDMLQHRIEIDLDTDTAGSRTAWTASACALITALLVFRRRERPFQLGGHLRCGPSMLRRPRRSSPAL
jgi:hypothetical protein